MSPKTTPSAPSVSPATPARWGPERFACLPAGGASSFAGASAAAAAVPSSGVMAAGDYARSARCQELVEPTMHERDRHRTVADRAGHPLGRAVADVARREQAGDAGLEREGVPGERPVGRPLAVGEQVGAGEDVARRVEPDAGVPGPAGAGRSAQAEEE